MSASQSCRLCARYAARSGLKRTVGVAASRPALAAPIRWHSTSKAGERLASDAYTTSPFWSSPTIGQRSQPAEGVPAGSSTTATAQAAISETPSNLSQSDRQALESMLRVDHAGEIAANTIYSAQANVFGALGDSKTKQMMLDMWENEKKHLKVAEKLLAQHKTRPSLLMPVWSSAGTVLGATTALMGKEAAMACTEAVETVIGEHYDDQLTHLRKTQEASNSEMHPSIPLLTEVITEFRDDELEHLDTAVEHDSQQAPGHALLSAVIGWGCKGAISIAKRL